MRNNKIYVTLLTALVLTLMFAGPVFAQATYELQIDPADQCNIGDEVVFEAVPLTGFDFDDPEYRFLYRPAGGSKIYVGQDASPNASWTVDAPAGSAGLWDFGVQVRESGASGWPTYDAVMGYEIIDPLAPSVSLDIDPAEVAEVGQEVTFTATSSNFVDPEYRFLYRVAGGTKIYEGRGAGASTWELTMPNSPGTYDVGVQVREKGTSGWPVYDIVFGYQVVDELLEIVSIEAVEATTTVALGAELEDAVESLNENTTYHGVLADNSTTTLTIVDWDSDEYSTTTEGTYEFTGTAELPAGYKWADGVSDQVIGFVVVEEQVAITEYRRLFAIY